MIASVVLLFFIVAVAVAFNAPSAKYHAKSSLHMSFKEALGAQPPLGFWDPLGLLKNADQARFDRLRSVEVKHGRISMLAILGHLYTTAGLRLPGNIAYDVPFSSVKSGLAALSDIPGAGIVQIVAFIGLLELGFGSVEGKIAESCENTMDSLGWDDDLKRKKAAVELNNGRAAQMGILALMVHEKLNNDPYVINSLLGYPVPFNQ
jgi:hypothetical protein